MYEFLSYLMRGGAYGHYWLKQSRETIWWHTSDIPEPPTLPQEDIYFGVHPSKIQKGTNHGTTLEDIAAINCVFADIDDKDFNSSATEHIKSIDPRPSVIISSGSGFHLYWLLDEPFILDSNFKVEIARSLQEQWAPYVGGDKAVHDLARILRLPGTYNYKHDTPQPVNIRYLNLQRTYTIEQLNEFLPEEYEHSASDDSDEPKIPKTKSPNNLSLQALVDKAQAAKDGSTFTSLWRGSTGSKYASTSEGDLALCALLAFWTGGDYYKIDRLFRLSGRYREKWEREDYRRGTILKALGQISSYYKDPGDLLLAGAHDEGNAQCISSRYGTQFLYNNSLGWRQYDGTRWEGSLAESHVWLKAIEILKARRAAAWNQQDDDRAKGVSRAATPTRHNIESALRILKEMLAVPIVSFDNNPDELNVKNGVLNLRTGILKSHHYTQRFTYCLPVDYNPQADSSIWTSWLLKAVGGSQEIVDYLQLAIGYSLTGKTREEVLFYLWGPARAGKGIFTETILAMLGGEPLGVEADIQMFMSGKSQDPQGFLFAGLRASRFLAASESKGRNWLDEARIKHLTGGNLIRCAYKGKDMFTYRPKFKIWLSSNIPPRLDPDDDAAWYRLRVIRFPTSHIEDIDKQLKTDMRRPEVLMGVLAWAVEGSKQWYKLPRSGLKTPTEIRDVTATARGMVDQIASWLADRVIDTGRSIDRVSYTDAFEDYQDYCRENGESSRPRKHWKEALKKKGYDMSHRFAFKKPNGTKGMKRGWVGKKLVGGLQIHIGGNQDDAD